MDDFPVGPLIKKCSTLDQVEIAPSRLILLTSTSDTWFGDYTLWLLNREKLLLHFLMRFWTSHCKVQLPALLLVAEENRLLLVWLLLEPLLPGSTWSCTLTHTHTHICIHNLFLIYSLHIYYSIIDFIVDHSHTNEELFLIGIGVSV